MFQPHSNDILDETRRKIRIRLELVKESLNQDDKTEVFDTPNVEPVEEKPKKVITTKNKLFFPNINYNIQPDIETYG